MELHSQGLCENYFQQIRTLFRTTNIISFIWYLLDFLACCQNVKQIPYRKKKKVKIKSEERFYCDLSERL